ncbi:MAG: glucosaminidase domain-containing protein [Bacteroidales bacterium]|nr:glucosaminidase domain-containing protein [Bacteroidales bacterium]
MTRIKNLIRQGYLTLFLLIAALSASGQSMNRITKEYIHKYKDIAIKEMKSYKIPASITLAQAILESGSGEGKLARRANNHFGIKCHGWTGKSIRMNDDTKHECFRKYKNPEASFKDHSKFLRKGERYAFLFNYPITDYRSWAYGLKRAGYATNPMYPQLLINLIQRYKLYQYDQKEPIEIGSSREFSGPYIEPLPENFEIKGTNVNNRPFYVNNGRKLVIVKPGDTFKQLAFDFEIRWGKLRRFNDVTRRFVLHPGDIIYLQRKAGRAARQYPYHIVKEGETLWQISQLYGIRLKKLRAKNNLPKKYQPPIGTKLRLR